MTRCLLALAIVTLLPHPAFAQDPTARLDLAMRMTKLPEKFPLPTGAALCGEHFLMLKDATLVFYPVMRPAVISTPTMTASAVLMAPVRLERELTRVFPGEGVGGGPYLEVLQTLDGRFKYDMYITADEFEKAKWCLPPAYRRVP